MYKINVCVLDVLKLVIIIVVKIMGYVVFSANIYFNRQCLKRQLTPSYANIKIPNTSPAHKHTQQKIPSYVSRMRSDTYIPKNKNSTNKFSAYILLWHTRGTTLGSTSMKGLKKNLAEIPRPNTEL
jgi:hypothetical protein